MALVFLAEDLKHRRTVAIKVLRPEFAAVVGAERFVREIEIAARLTHPHIVPLYDSGEAAGYLYYLMPYVEGESLRERLDREKQLQLEDALQLAREVADAMTYAHSHGVVHRDLKPENILLESGHAVVTDFGIARAITAAGGDKLTQTGVFIGTPPYMSPEQATGDQPVDGRSDIYSLGCVVYEMLAGQTPFTGATAESILHQHLVVKARPVSSIRPNVPPAVVTVLARALSKSPADRFSTAAQFDAALRTASSTPAMLPARGRRPARILAITAAAAAVAAAVWLGSDRLAAGRTGAMMARRPYTIVADVEGSAEADIRAAVRRLLVTALDQSTVVVTLDDGQVKRGLELAGKPATTPLDATTARELAVRGSIRTVVSAAVDRVGRTFSVSVRVLDAEEGTPVVIEQRVAADSNQVIQTVDAVARAVRQGLGERGSAIVANRPLREGATGSFAAYRKYARGRDLLLFGDARASLPLFKEAIALDSTFGEAWRSLGVSYNNLGIGDSGRRAIFEAFNRGTGMTEAQRLTTQAFVAGYRGDLAAAVEALERVVQEYGAGQTNLANTLVQVDRTAEAVALTEEQVRADPFGPRQPDVVNLANWLPVLGRFDEARTWAAQVTGVGAVSTLATVAAAQGDWVTAESVAMRLLKDPSAERIHRRDALDALASSQAARGRVQAAFQSLREQMGSGTAGRGARSLLVLSVSSGAPVSRSTLSTLRSNTSASGRTLTALWAAAVGDTGVARRDLDAVRNMPAEDRQAGRVEGEVVLVEAWIAASGHRWEEVVRLLGPLAGRTYWASPSNQLTRWTLADAYEHIGRLDSAAAYFEGVANWKRFSELEQSRRGLTESFAHRRLVLLYAKMGHLDDARRHWKAFSAAFTSPDPEMLAFIEEARDALERAERAAR